MTETQLGHMYVIIGEKNFIQNVQQALELDRIDQLVGTLSFNYIARTSSFTNNVRHIAQNTCNTARSLVLHNLEKLKQHPDSVTNEVFGIGYSSVVLGGVIYAWECNKVPVTLNKDATLDTQDIPVFYEKDGKKIEAYVDILNFKLKNTTQVLPKNDVVHPKYLIEKKWYCKRSTSIEECEGPPMISIDVSSIKDALDDLLAATIFDGGFVDSESREQWNRVTSLPSQSQDIVFNLTSQIALGDVNAIEESLDLYSIQDQVLSSVLQQMIGNPFAIKAMGLFGVFVIAVVSYFVYTCKRLLSIKAVRNAEQDPEAKVSKMNYVYAVFEPRRVDVNMNARCIQDLKTGSDKIAYDILQLENNIDAKFGIENYSKLKVNDSIV